MKLFKITLLGLLLGLMTSCSQEKLPNDIIENNQGYEKLTDYIYSHYPDLKDNIEVMNFIYTASIHPQRDETSSYYKMNFVNAKNKDRVVEYTINHNGKLSNSNVDISVGDNISNQKLSNKYDTYKPFLFSSKKINLDILREIISKSINNFKKDTNVDKAYCSSIRIEKSPNKEPEISITIKQRKFASTIMRSSNWTIKGQKIE